MDVCLVRSERGCGKFWGRGGGPSGTGEEATNRDFKIGLEYGLPNAVLGLVGSGLNGLSPPVSTM